MKLKLGINQGLLFMASTIFTIYMDCKPGDDIRITALVHVVQYQEQLTFRRIFQKTWTTQQYQHTSLLVNKIHNNNSICHYFKAINHTSLYKQNKQTNKAFLDVMSHSSCTQATREEEGEPFPLPMWLGYKGIFLVRCTYMATNQIIQTKSRPTQSWNTEMIANVFVTSSVQIKTWKILLHMVMSGTWGVPRVSGCSYSTGEVLNCKLIGYQFSK